MKQRTKSKGLIILNLILLLALFIIPVYAYWASNVSGANKDTTADIVIGEGQTAETTITLTDYETDGVLVPVGKSVAGQVEEINFDLTLVWTETTNGWANGATGELNLTTTPSHDLLEVALTNVPATVELGTTYTINVKVTLTEPADIDEYNEVVNQTLTILFNIVVVPNA